MKALSIRQPWASMIVFGFKRVENRTWNTHYRGPMLIHASQAVDKTAMEWLWKNQHELGLTRGWHLLPFRTGGIVGMAELFDVSCRTEKAAWWPATPTAEQDQAWFFGPRGLWLRDAKPLPFRPLRGKLGFFEVGGE